VVFEVQENSDVTFRLFDWEHVDPRTGRQRPLQVEKALACVNLMQGSIAAVAPVVETMQPVMRERFFDNSHFRLWRLQSAVPFVVGVAEEPRIWCVSRAEATSNSAVPTSPSDKAACCFCPRLWEPVAFVPIAQ
jgi:hypothetical protein